ncbi:MAG TPA: prepilin-type N-terminal cleavage/methylation domain-containing protein, partial [Deltaproteobacteria bacterium]|nr:prepilin-type N-terminal cleavage/methylation domain-containing protein [Deltaproteobacteria bacterium]
MYGEKRMRAGGQARPLNGFTLLELLVAMALSALLVLGAG